ncbi:MAG: AtpZ/AtpI family protein [Actinomycetes bacterium]
MRLLPDPKIVRRIAGNPRAAENSAGGLGHGAEIAFGVLIFFLIGFAIDHFAGTTPVFMIVMTVFSCVGNFVKMWFGYDTQMKRLEEERAETRRAKPPVQGEQ